MRRRRRPRALLLGTACALAVVGAAACGGDGDDSADATSEATTSEATTSEATTSEATTTKPPDPEPVAPRAEPGLPGFTAGYQDWLRLNQQPIPPSAAAPHGEEKNVYVSETRADITQGGAQTFPYPDGSIVLKTGSRGGDEAAIVAIMRKIAGVDRAHGDWEYVEYSRTSSSADYTVLARDEVCWTCHVQAESTDWVFTTLP